MELRHLITFRHLAETLHFTKTAASLGYVQSNVSAQIQALERDLGVRLFDRLGKRVALTEAGERLRPYANEIVALLAEAQAALPSSGVPKGTVRISAPESVCTYRLSPLLQTMRAQHPGVQVVFAPGPVSDLLPRVRSGEIDVAFALDRPLFHADLMTHPLRDEPILVVGHATFPLVGYSAITAADLQGFPMLVTQQGCAYRARFEQILAEGGVTGSDTFEFGSVEAIKQCVSAGMGFAVLPQMALSRELTEGSLVALPWAGPSLDLELQVVWHRKRWCSPAVRTLIEAAQALQWD